MVASKRDSRKQTMTQLYPTLVGRLHVLLFWSAGTIANLALEVEARQRMRRTRRRTRRSGADIKPNERSPDRWGNMFCG